ncbi:unnamed protein product [Allacma fusca]|uniref:Ig-like domain-containing protein n=1 Tax=Allacma fusca TaxID=39272 RepID=A0A8J2L7Y5_9HEXA|nr:unnamed protein product [Allacma fusca]
MIFYFRINKLVHLMLPLIFHTFLLNSSGAKKIGEKNSAIPRCSLELFNRFNNPDKALYRVTLTGSSGPKIKCVHHNYTNAPLSVRCEGGTIFVETGLASSSVRIGCFDRHPLQYEQDHALPFAGIDTDFRKYILKDGAVQHKVYITFPKIHLDDEGLEVYSGVYKFSREEPKWDAHFELNFTSVNHNRADTGEKKDMCIKVFDERADCEVGHSNSDVYFVNVGGENPTETRLLKPCLDPSMQNSCGNKFPGSNCVQRRYCKKLKHIHAHGLVRCTADNVTNDVEYFRDIFADIHTNMSEMWDHSLIIRIEEDNNASRLEIEYEENPASLENTDYNSACPQMTSILGVKPQENLTFYNEEFYNLECHFISYFLVPPVLWFAGWNDGSKTQLFVDYGGKISKETKYFVNDPTREVTVSIESSKLKQALRDMTYISCEMWYWNSSEVAKNVQQVHVKESQSPVFSPCQEFRNVESGDTLMLECKDPIAKPPPNYRWTFKGQDRGQGSVLSITNVGTSGSGEYSCIASNFKGHDSKVFKVTVNGATGSLNTVLGSLVVVLILLFLLLLAIYNELRKRRANLSTAEINDFINGHGAGVDQNDAYANARHPIQHKHTAN